MVLTAGGVAGTSTDDVGSCDPDDDVVGDDPDDDPQPATSIATMLRVKARDPHMPGEGSRPGVIARTNDARRLHDRCSTGHETYRDLRKRRGPSVGVTGFEPAAFRSQSGCATKLRYTPARGTTCPEPVTAPLSRRRGRWVSILSVRRAEPPPGGRSLVVKPQSSKLMMRVRFSSPAPLRACLGPDDPDRRHFPRHHRHPWVVPVCGTTASVEASGRHVELLQPPVQLNRSLADRRAIGGSCRTTCSIRRAQARNRSAPGDGARNGPAALEPRASAQPPN